MVTPFTQDGELDLDTAQALAVHLVDQGADGLVVTGTTGETSTLTDEENVRMFRAVVEAVGDRAQVIAGTGTNDTAHSVHLSRQAQETGVDGLLLVTPYYNKPSQEGIRRHFETIASSTDLPVMLYDIPGRTGVAIGDDALDRLAEHPRILAVKDATGDVPHGFERMARTGLEFYSGDDNLNFAWLAHGASGVVSVVGHLLAGAYAEMVQEVDDGDLVAARGVANTTRTVVDAIMGGGQGAVMVKEALYLQGRLPSPTVRLPLVRAAETEIAALESVLRQEGHL